MKKQLKRFLKKLMKFSFRPRPRIEITIFLYFLVAVIFIVIGSLKLKQSLDLNEHRERYDNNEKCEIGKKCQIQFKLKEKFKKPVFFYYEVKGFYQNHRKYIRSIITKQLRGSSVSSHELEDCDPVKKNKDLKITDISITGKPLDPEEIAYPCGIAA